MATSSGHAPAPTEEHTKEFNKGLRSAAAERTAADADGDNQLDFDEFVAMIRVREGNSELPIETIRLRFDKLDTDHSGKISMSEYLLVALREALGRNSLKLIEIFKEWDRDGSGSIEKREFRRAIKCLGFEASRAQIDAVFDELDYDESGTIEVEEMRRFQRDCGPNEVIGRDGVKRKSLGHRGAALPDAVKLDEHDPNRSVTEQLRGFLKENAVRICPHTASLGPQFSASPPSIIGPPPFALISPPLSRAATVTAPHPRRCECSMSSATGMRTSRATSHAMSFARRWRCSA